MQKYDTIINDFLQYKHFLGYKYKTDSIILKEILNYLRENEIEKITKEATENYARINNNLDTNTIARNMGVFRELCAYMKNNKNIECYQIPKYLYPQNHNKYKPHIFSHNEIKNIYDSLNNYKFNYHYNYYRQISYPLIIKILYQTGMRIGEVFSLTFENFNSDIGIFTLLDTKNGQERNVAIPDSLNKEILKYCNKFTLSNKDLIFKVSTNSIEKYFDKIMRLSNIKITDDGPTLHCLRHTYIVHTIEKAIANDTDLEVLLPILQAQVGHQSLESLSYYFHMTNDLLNTVNKISEQELGYLIRKLGEEYE